MSRDLRMKCNLSVSDTPMSIHRSGDERQTKCLDAIDGINAGCARREHIQAGGGEGERPLGYLPEEGRGGAGRRRRYWF